MDEYMFYNRFFAMQSIKILLAFMKQISRNIKKYKFSLLGDMLEVKILRKVLDYSSIKSKAKVYVRT